MKMNLTGYHSGQEERKVRRQKGTGMEQKRYETADDFRNALRMYSDGDKMTVISIDDLPPPGGGIQEKNKK